MGSFPHATGPWLEPLRQRIRTLIARLPPALAEFLMFGLKQAWACLFAAIMLALLILTHLVWADDWPVSRYDALFVAAIVVQIAFLAFKLESLDELKVIVLYHVSGTVMEIFKVRMGSWSYPEPAVFAILGVPLFSGFMYGSVGSFIARTMRIFDMRFTHYPPVWLTLVLAAAIYLNFFSHHFLPDLRYVLMAATVIVYARVSIYFTPDRLTLRMPLVIAALLTAIFLWLAENIGTVTGTWIYPSESGWQPVSLGKFGSWYLLIYVSFVLVTLVIRPVPPGARTKSSQR
ncbi:DUF817 domain-containing protein [Pseudohoeflea coraliihabitans]|uniref:DUF817 domain-containing protein n=1 Tax=Pseudohoeflea coraliihabitans TaxID=2860393 RepID=A0ABS6WQS7_9HYPH|nr:DUF817 domain-containing protein [Pseudohoeflea sp. DP4N28-3]MBW3097752.1 DUF817 domain-containing protein [Pseudohoeflea sp. DP4N28-3]